MIRSLTLLLVCATALLLTGTGCKKTSTSRPAYHRPPAPGEPKHPFNTSISDYRTPKDVVGPRSLKK
jgi:hypothetical protein